MIFGLDMLNVIPILFLTKAGRRDIHDFLPMGQEIKSNIENNKTQCH